MIPILQEMPGYCRKCGYCFLLKLLVGMSVKVCITQWKENECGMCGAGWHSLVMEFGEKR